MKDPEELSPAPPTVNYGSSDEEDGGKQSRNARHRPNSRSARRDNERVQQESCKIDACKLRGLKAASLKVASGGGDPNDPNGPGVTQAGVFHMSDGDSPRPILPMSDEKPPASSSGVTTEEAMAALENERFTSKMKENAIIDQAKNEISHLHGEINKVNSRSLAESMKFEHDKAIVTAMVQKDVAILEAEARSSVESQKHELNQRFTVEQTQMKESVLNAESRLHSEKLEMQQTAHAEATELKAAKERILHEEELRKLSANQWLSNEEAQLSVQQQKFQEAEVELSRKSESYIEGIRAQLQREFEQRDRDNREQFEKKVLEQRQMFSNKGETDDNAKEIKRLGYVMNELGKQNEQLMANVASIVKQSKDAADAHRASQEAKDTKLFELIEELKTLRQPAAIGATLAGTVTTKTKAAASSSQNAAGGNPGKDPGRGPPGDDGNGDKTNQDDQNEEADPSKDQNGRRNKKPSGSGNPDGGDSSDPSDDDSGDFSHLPEEAQKAIRLIKRKNQSHGKVDDIVLPALPEPSGFKKWRAEVRNTVKAAFPSNPDRAFQWVLEVEDPDKLVEDFARCDKRFLALDATLDAAVDMLMAESVGDLAKRIFNFKETNAKLKQPTRGRQTLWMVYDDFSVGTSSGVLFDIEDLMNVKLNHDKLEAFLNRWDTVNIHLRTASQNSLLEALFVGQVRQSNKMRVHFEACTLAEAGSQTHSYEYLYKSARAIVLRERRDRVRKKTLGNVTLGVPSGMVGNEGSGAADERGRPPGERYKPSEILCYYYQIGDCRRGKDCKFSHDKNSYKIKGTKPAPRASSRPRGRSPSAGNNKCSYFDGTKESCPYGSKCKFKHDKDNPEPTRTKDKRSPSPGKRSGSPRRPKDGKKGGNKIPSGKGKKDKGKKRGQVAAAEDSDEEQSSGNEEKSGQDDNSGSSEDSDSS